ncbi:hypothetical protein C4572_01320 [Candidatus Parcubacteria bacterium]|nr:MAG: hypothetical protein C4572_01320 [Candidatus Parcubacteria bacterium]
MRSICVFGDNAAYGVFDHEKGGWAGRLREYLDNHDTDLVLYNLGVLMENTTDLLIRFEVEATARVPKVIIFQIGLHDSLYVDDEENHPVPLKAFGRNIERLIMAAQKITPKILFIGINSVDERKTMPTSWNKSIFFNNRNATLYDSEIRKVATEKGVAHLPVSDSLKVRDLEDGLCLNSKGHAKIFKLAKKFLEEKKWL